MSSIGKDINGVPYPGPAIRLNRKTTKLPITANATFALKKDTAYTIFFRNAAAWDFHLTGETRTYNIELAKGDRFEFSTYSDVTDLNLIFSGTTVAGQFVTILAY